MVVAKTTYRIQSTLEVFYTGGPAALFPDGTHLACACADEVKIVHLETGTVVRTLPGDSEPVTALAISPDGTLIFTASRALLLRAWSTETGRPVQTFVGHRAPVAGMAVHSSGTLLATVSADHTTRVWDIAGGYCTHSFGGHRGVVLAVVFHPQQMSLITASEDSEIRVWDLISKSCSAVLQGHFSAITCITVSPDGATLLSGSRDGVCITWDLAKRAKRATTAVMEAVEGIAILKSGSPLAGGIKPAKGSLLFATGGEKGRVRIWRGDKGTTVLLGAVEGGDQVSEKTTGELPNEGAITEVLGGSADSLPLIVTTQDGRVLVYAANEPVTTLPRQLVGNNDEVTDIRLVERRLSHGSTSASPGDNNNATQKCVAVATNAGVIRIFSLPRFDCVASLVGHSATVLALDACVVADASVPRQILLSGSKDCGLRLWDVDSAQCLGAAEGHVAAVAAVALSRRRPGAFAVSAGADKVLKVWDLEGILLKKKSSSSSDVAEGAEQRLRALTAVAAHDKDINAVAISPDDRLIVTGSQDRTAKLWRLPDLVAGPTLRGHRRGIWSAAFSPVDQVVVTASADSTLRLWSAVDGSCLRALEGHLAAALRGCWVTLGTQLVSSGADGLLKLWSARTGECLHTSDAADDKIWALDSSNDGETLVTGSGDGRLVLWQDATADTAADALAAADAAVAADQAYANALASGDWAAAAKTALERDQPRRLLAAVNAVLERAEEQQVQPTLQSLVGSLDDDALRRVLEIARDWNTHARSCHAAAAVLQAVLLTRSPGTLCALPGVAAILEAIVAYTQRHADRINRLARSAYLVDHVLDTMDVLEPMNVDENRPVDGHSQNGVLMA